MEKTEGDQLAGKGVYERILLKRSLKEWYERVSVGLM
jgi:hypothetical protein